MGAEDYKQKINYRWPNLELFSLPFSKFVSGEQLQFPRERPILHYHEAICKFANAL